MCVWSLLSPSRIHGFSQLQRPPSDERPNREPTICGGMCQSLEKEVLF